MPIAAASRVGVGPPRTITLGFIGIMMLVIALTLEWERALVKTTGRKIRETFTGWR